MPDFSEETSNLCPDGHELVYHPAKPNCLSDGWDEYFTCKNCTEYSTQVIKPALGGHTLVCPTGTCAFDGHKALHTCSTCGYGMVAEPENRYYVSKLTQTQYEVYKTVYDAIMNFEEEIEFEPGLITRNEWSNVILWTLSYDSPELMQIDSRWNTTTVEIDEVSYITSISPVYQMTRSQYENALKLVSDTFSSWQTELLGKSEYEMELFVHDYMTGNTTYSAESTYANCTYGVLHDKLVRCEGYAKTMTWAMWSMSIPATSIVGEAGGVAHAFNAVAIDGKYSFVDVTWDLGNTFAVHDYFNVDSDILLTTHTIDPDFVAIGYPECSTMEYNYAVVNGLYFDQSNLNTLVEKLHAELDKAKLDTDHVIELRFATRTMAEQAYSTVASAYQDWPNGGGQSCLISTGSNNQIMIKLKD